MHMYTHVLHLEGAHAALMLRVERADSKGKSKVESPELLVGRDFIVMIARCLIARAPPRDNILAARWYAQPIPCAPPRMSRGAILSADSSSLPCKLSAPQSSWQDVLGSAKLLPAGASIAPAAKILAFYFSAQVGAHGARRQDQGRLRALSPRGTPCFCTQLTRALLSCGLSCRQKWCPDCGPATPILRVRCFRDAARGGRGLWRSRDCCRAISARAALRAPLTAGHRASFIAQDCYEESDGGEAWEVVYVPSDVSREQVRVGGNARGALSVRLEVGLPCWHAPAVAVAVSLLCACGSGESDRDLTLAVAAPATHSRRRSTSPRRTAGGRGLRLARRPPRR